MKKSYLLWLVSLLVFCPFLFSQEVRQADEILGTASSGVVTFWARDQNKNIVGEGTGFALADNLIVVPYHLVCQASEAEVNTISGKRAKVEALVATDRDFDLAIIRIKGKVDSLLPGTSEKLNPEDRLLSLNEINGNVVITEGNLKGWLEISPGRVKIMEVSMNLEKPACGAPLFDDQGNVVGVALVFGPGVKFGVPIEPVLALDRGHKGQDLKSAPKENYFELAEGCYFVGKVACLLNEPGLATVYLEKYIGMKPDDPEGHLLLGKAYYQLGNNTAAQKCYSKVISLEPGHPEGLYGLGLTQLRGRNFQEAAEAFEQAISNNIDSNEIFFELGTAYEELGDLNRAVENFEKYAKLGPANPYSTWLKIAQAYVRLDQAEKAITAYREALKINPDDINCNYNLAKLLADSNQLEEAEILFKKLAEKNPNDAITYYGQIMQMYDRAEKYDKAVEAARKIVDLNPKNEAALYNLAIMYDRLGQLEEAARTLNQCLAIKNDYTYAWFNLGIIYDKMKKHSEAVEAFKKYTALAPEDPSGWLNIGLEYMLMKDFESALPNLQKSVSLKPDNPIAQYNLGITYINLNDYYSAREVLRVLQNLDPNLANRLSRLIK